MSALELEACRVPVDPTFPTHVEEYVVSFTAFYERGFGVPPHQFLHSLLWYYGLELHHLTPSKVLHITVFVTLCEAYLGINLDLDLWKYLFHVCHPQDPEVELMISRGVVTHVKIGHEVDPYLEIPTPWLMKGWQKKLFYQKYDDSALLPMFTGGRPIPMPSWGGGELRPGRTSEKYNFYVSTFNSYDRRG
jgi:hypothetical protein